MRICSTIGFFFIKALTNLFGARVSCKRIEVLESIIFVSYWKSLITSKELLLQNEIIQKTTETKKDEIKSIIVRNLNAKWNEVRLDILFQ